VNLEHYNYNLPTELIAQKPAEKRDQSRLMVLSPDSKSVKHRKFSDLPKFLKANDLLVINDTKVFPARLIGRKEHSGGKVELLLLRSLENSNWEALSRPAKSLRNGTVVLFGNGLIRAEIIEKGTSGYVKVNLESSINIEDAIDKIGETPLPPYIKREPVPSDHDRYQTIYAQRRGSVAAPTAGLHFTQSMLDELSSRGVKTAAVTLHVGIGTFRPLSASEAQKKTLHSEYCIVPESTVLLVRKCREKGGKIFAVGTTTARALETASLSGEVKSFSGWTDLFIKPPYQFRSVDALVTNFHLPCSSLLLMVSAFAGEKRILDAYRKAINEKYRFYSYGDAMLVILSKK